MVSPSARSALGWGLLALAALAGFARAGEAGAAEARPPAATPAAFAVLPPAPASAAGTGTGTWLLSGEMRFAGHDWQRIERETARLATVTVGSFEGVPTGRSGQRAVRIHTRSYEAHAETRGAVVLVSQTGRCRHRARLRNFACCPISVRGCNLWQ